MHFLRVFRSSVFHGCSWLLHVSPLFHFEAREKQLLPLYTSVATTFADLHDRAGRMKAKGVIKESISWKDEGLIGHEIGTKDWGILLGIGT